MGLGFTDLRRGVETGVAQPITPLRHHVSLQLSLDDISLKEEERNPRAERPGILSSANAPETHVNCSPPNDLDI